MREQGFDSVVFEDLVAQPIVDEATYSLCQGWPSGANAWIVSSSLALDSRAWAMKSGPLSILIPSSLALYQAYE